ncbi:MAG: hypothetical protein HY330_02525, partial [Chloroflexi bacterium]|nr:hypothetical protein [Chloroflexota bacterium]
MSTGVPTRGAPAASPALGSGKARALGAAGAALSQAAPAAGLILALAAAFLMGLIPKRDYLYLLHVDEWAHFDGALAVLEPGNLGFSQGGFHLLLAQLQYVTGLDWFVLFRWLPPVFFATTVFLAYIVGRRFRCGLESALLA